jgi:hypothetical protein
MLPKGPSGFPIRLSNVPGFSRAGRANARAASGASRCWAAAATGHELSATFRSGRLASQDPHTQEWPRHNRSLRMTNFETPFGNPLNSHATSYPSFS